MLRNRIAWLTALLLALAILPACSDDDDGTTILAPQVGLSFVRVAHLSPDAPNVDVWVDGAVALSNVAFRGFSSYLELEAGEHRIQVTPTGASSPIVIDATVTLAENTSYTVAAQGLLASISANVLVDDRAASGSTAKVRFAHASPDAPPVDITLTDGTVLFGAVSFGESVSIPVGPGTYDLQVRVAGAETVVLSFGDVDLAAATNYTVFAIGQLADASLTALISVDSPGDGGATVGLTPATSDVRVGHLSPDAFNVDIWVDGALVPSLVNVPFGAVSGYLELSAATHQVQVFQTGTSAGAVIDATLTLLPGEAYTVAAAGLAANIAPIVLVDDREPAAGNAHVRFVHTSPDAPAVDIAVKGGPTLFTNTSFGEFAGYDPVGPGTYDLEVLLNSNKDLALAVDGVALSGSTNYTIFAIGLAGDGSLAALPVVDTP